MKLLTDEYLKLLRDKHAHKPWGGTGHSWVPHVCSIVDKLPYNDMYTTVLDYGCGRGTLKTALQRERPDLSVKEYDPAIPGKDTPPDPAHIVVCTDVLEHVEEQFVDQTLKYLAALSLRSCFMVIACHLSYSLLPDGRNTHITVQLPDWWIERIKKAFQGFEVRVLERRKGRVIAEATRCT